MTYHLGVSMILFATALVASAQSPASETQARGYWVDPDTGLMWAAKDSGKDLTWAHAMKYCQDLPLADYADWRLASLAEMEGIYDRNVEVPGLAGPRPPLREPRDVLWHVKGKLYLTGYLWTSSRRIDPWGKVSAYAWRFDFVSGKGFGGEEPGSGFRALCVRTRARSETLK